MSKQSVKIGPEMPEVPSVRAEPAPDEQTGADVPAAPESIRTTDAFGNVVETITAVATVKTESPVQVSARAKSRRTDSFGNIVETY